jgi:hypothetical protein
MNYQELPAISPSKLIILNDNLNLLLFNMGDVTTILNIKIIPKIFKQSRILENGGYCYQFIDLSQIQVFILRITGHPVADSLSTKVKLTENEIY